MNTSSQASLPDFQNFWVRWIAVTVGGALAAYVLSLGWVLLTLFAQAPEAAPAVIPWFLLGFGLLAGAGQARLLRPWLTQRVIWALGGAVALFLASQLTYAVTGSYFAMPGISDRYALSVLMHFGQGAVLGAAIGLAQFHLLARTRHSPSRWLVASILIWACADGLGTVFSGPQGTHGSEMRWLFNFLLMTLLAAIAGGATMAWLLELQGRRLSFAALAAMLLVAAAGVSQSGTWALELIQEQPGQQFGEVYVAGRPAWSPDGELIAFVRGERNGESRLYSAPADGGQATALSGYHDSVLFVRWVPDGAYVCYGSYSETFIAAIPGIRPATSTNCGLAETRSPDAQLTASIGSDGNNIHVRGPGGTEQILEVEKPDLPDWSPDNSRLLYRSYRIDNYEVYMIDLEGTGEINLSQYPGHDSQPMWLPGGSEILFESDRDGARNLYVMQLADGSLRQLTTNTNVGLAFYRIVLSPDGSQLVYHTFWFDSGGITVSGIAGPHLMRLDGSGLVALPEPDTDEFWLWSPDGMHLMTARNGRIWVVGADGSQLRQLALSFGE